MSEILGESTPYKIQKFINRGRWSADDLRDVLQNKEFTSLPENLTYPVITPVVFEYLFNTRK